MKGEKSICLTTVGVDKDKLKVFSKKKKRAFEKRGGILRMLVRLNDSIPPETTGQTINLKQAIGKINKVLRRLGQKINFEEWLTSQNSYYRNLIVSVLLLPK